MTPSLRAVLLEGAMGPSQTMSLKPPPLPTYMLLTFCMKGRLLQALDLALWRRWVHPRSTIGNNPYIRRIVRFDP